jgi:hypothetical protein
MKTAVFLSGQLRTFAQCWPTQRWHILRHFQDPHFFICVQHQADAHQILAPLVAEYGAARVHTAFRTDPDLHDVITPELSRAYHIAPYANAAPAHQLLLQHWYNQEVWKLFSECQSPAESARFNVFIRLRPDLFFHSFDCPEVIEGINDPFWDPEFTDLCFTPWWGRFGGINDRFALMGAAAARYYLTTYEAIPELLSAGCPFHPESLVKANLERGNIDLRETLRTEFTTFRLDGKHRPPEIAPWDLAHAALR